MKPQKEQSICRYCSRARGTQQLRSAAPPISPFCFYTLSYKYFPYISAFYSSPSLFLVLSFVRTTLVTISGLQFSPHHSSLYITFIFKDLFF
ncbi:hypothetical protein RJT34_10653 [Clitoria ternatea]|uniref:Uncharacterized protein n=1 Tax=Clitoria ternatea TaxID=43366 RepID=A0AAN9PHQ7_CLITE